MKSIAERGLTGWFASRRWGAAIVTLVIIVVVGVRSIWPDLIKLDAISVALIVLALVPWMRSIVSSIEVAGVGKVDLRDVESVAATVDAADLPQMEVTFSTAVHDLQPLQPFQPLLAVPADAEDVEDAIRLSDEESEIVRKFRSFGHRREYGPTYEELNSYIDESNLATGKLSLWAHVKSELGIADAGSRSYASAALLLEITLRLKRLAELHGVDPSLTARRQLKALEKAGVLTGEQARAVELARTMLTAMLKGPSSPVTELRAEQVAQEVAESLAYLIRQREGKSVQSHSGAMR